MLKNQKKNSKLYILGLILFFIGIVFLWRGLWNLIDAFFIPNNILLSNLISIAIGFIIVYVILLIYNQYQ